MICLPCVHCFSGWTLAINVMALFCNFKTDGKRDWLQQSQNGKPYVQISRKCWSQGSWYCLLSANMCDLNLRLTSSWSTRNLVLCELLIVKSLQTIFCMMHRNARACVLLKLTSRPILNAFSKIASCNYNRSSYMNPQC